jgi:hypothetical protein
MTIPDLDEGVWIDVSVSIHHGMVHWPGDAFLRARR